MELREGSTQGGHDGSWQPPLWRSEQMAGSATRVTLLMAVYPEPRLLGCQHHCSGLPSLSRAPEGPLCVQPRGSLWETLEPSFSHHPCPDHWVSGHWPDLPDRPQPEPEARPPGSGITAVPTASGEVSGDLPYSCCAADPCWPSSHTWEASPPCTGIKRRV